MSVAAPPCRLPDCPVGATGSCKRGFDPVDSCPDFGPGVDVQAELSPPEESAVERTLPENIDDLIYSPISRAQPVNRLPSGDVMYASGLADLLRAERPRIVALVGEQQAGKTT